MNRSFWVDVPEHRGVNLGFRVKFGSGEAWKGFHGVNLSSGRGWKVFHGVKFSSGKAWKDSGGLKFPNFRVWKPFHGVKFRNVGSYRTVSASGGATGTTCPSSWM